VVVVELHIIIIIIIIIISSIERPRGSCPSPPRTVLLRRTYTHRYILLYIILYTSRPGNPAAAAAVPREITFGSGPVRGRGKKPLNRFYYNIILYYIIILCVRLIVEVVVVVVGRYRTGVSILYTCTFIVCTQYYYVHSYNIYSYVGLPDCPTGDYVISYQVYVGTHRHDLRLFGKPTNLRHDVQDDSSYMITLFFRLRYAVIQNRVIGIFKYTRTIFLNFQDVLYTTKKMSWRRMCL